MLVSNQVSLLDASLCRANKISRLRNTYYGQITKTKSMLVGTSGTDNITFLMHLLHREAEGTQEEFSFK
jgi:hypothetical protein